MKKITLSLDEETLAAGRAFARRHQTTLDAVVREFLVKTVVSNRANAIREMFRLMDANPGKSQGVRWTRDDLYDR